MSVETAEGIVPTRLLLFSGNHKFVAAARDLLLDALAKHHVEDRVREALVGPWLYDTKAQAGGWDAASRDDTAAMAAAPSASKKPGVPGAYWLVWESLPEEKEEIPGLDDLQPRDLLDLNRVGDVALGGAVMALRENTGKLDQGLLDRFDEISDDFVTKGANAALKQAMPSIERGLEQMCDVVRNGFHDEKKACLAGNDQSSIRGRAPVEIARCPQRAQPGFLISLASGKYANGSSADFGVPRGIASRRTVSSRLTGVEALTISRLGFGTACLETETCARRVSRRPGRWKKHSGHLTFLRARGVFNTWGC